MSTELESYYKDYIFKTHIAYTDEKCIERGVFATEDIKIGDIIETYEEVKTQRKL